MDLPDPSPPGGPPPGAAVDDFRASPWDRAQALIERYRDDRRLATVAVLAALVAAALAYGGYTAVRPPSPPRPEDVLPRVALSPTSAPTTTAAPVVIHVVGAVAAPGVQQVPAGARILDALEAAGGPTAEADLAQLNLAAPVTDGTQIRVPTVGESPPGPLIVAPSGDPSAGGGASSGAGSNAPVDLNTATPQELEELPGVGPATAAAIVAWRDRNGRFASVDQLLEVRGIGPAKFEAVRDLVVVR